MPLFLRISATDWLEEVKEIPESWTPEDTVKLAPLLAERGVDLLDVSSGGQHPKQHPHVKPAYQAPFAIQVKKAVGSKMAVGSVGSIENGTLANDLLEKEGLDLTIVGRGFQKNPGLVFAWADEVSELLLFLDGTACQVRLTDACEQLKQPVQMPNQIRWGFGGRGKDSGMKPALDIPELIGKP